MLTEPSSTYHVSDFDYELPEELIAKYPAPRRDQSRMLVLNREQQTVNHSQFRTFPQWCQPGDLVVFNNAKVIPARLLGYRDGGSALVEIFLLHPQNEARTLWQVLMKPAKRLKPGTMVRFKNDRLTAKVMERFDMGQGIVELVWDSQMSLEAVLDEVGILPIPPYMARETEAIDWERYQTVFAEVPGAQAAPTAGLHFTQEVLEQLDRHGVRRAEITLHVSSGTFRPVLSECVTEHRMDAEFYTIGLEAVDMIRQAQAEGGRVIAIGTTVAKTLETAWLRHSGHIQAESAWSELFITPGFQFQVVDTLLTNFHLPKSTLLMLVSAFASKDLILNAYQSAIREKYRFYSYGDCMLIT